MRLALCSLLGIVCLGLLIPKVAFAAPEGNDVQVIASGTVYHGSYYIHAPEIRVEGQLDGDLVVSAAQKLVVSGVVNGEVLSYGADIIIEPGAVVTGSVRVIGGSLTVSGTVRGDVTPAVQRLIVTPEAQILGNLYYWAGSTDIRGKIVGAQTSSAPPAKRGGWFERFDALFIGMILLLLLCKLFGIGEQALPASPFLQAILGFGLLLLTIVLLGIVAYVPALRLPALAGCAWIGAALTVALYDLVAWVGAQAFRPWPRFKKWRLAAISVLGSALVAACINIPLLWVVPVVGVLMFVPGRLLPVRARS